jgi:hypothetical protein
MVVRTMTDRQDLPQIFLGQYEKLVARFAETAAELEKERNMRISLQKDLELAETILSGYQEAEYNLDLPHHINHNG